jgi:Putative beta-barrel porin-2, OmpL-like. bbp2
MFYNAGKNTLLPMRQKSAPTFLLFFFVVVLLCGAPTPAQTSTAAPETISNADLAKQVAELRALVLQLQAQVNELQHQPAVIQTAVYTPTAQAPPAMVSNSADQAPSMAANLAPQPLQSQTTSTGSSTTPKLADVLHGTTLNFLFDGYYAYNFNDPIGRVNLLRAFDISSNAFSLNQADVVLENLPDPANGKRFGARLDLQYGQATETLQGNPANEPRPDIYRNIFQAYGTYIVPLGSGLTVDFGKWASSLGMEGNYTQDQINYSRSYWFDFLPFYHMGARVHYQFNDKFGVNYWITNGTQQTEPFNGYKDEMFGFVVTPAKQLTWTVNYYLGQEHPDFQFVTNGPPNLPTIQGAPFEPIVNPPSGKLHIFDSYAIWNATGKLTLAAEADYVIERLYTYSAPSHDNGGAAYFRYQLTPKIALAVRAEYLSDYGGLYSGKTQALKETTATFEYKFSTGFLMREEWRRDWSNQPYFLSDTLGILKANQTTATIGLVWWFGGKEGAW